MRDDDIALSQEFIGHAHTFAQQAARILPKVEDQSFEFAKVIERARDLFLRGLLESRDVHVTDAWTNDKVQVNAVPGDLVARDAEDNGLLRTLAQHCDLDDRP